jgi:serine/threonine protein kinase
VKKVIKLNVSTSTSLKERELITKINLCKEAILLFTCNYPNVVKIYDFIENPITIVMEYCAKGSLRNILDKRIYLPPLYKIFLIYSICDGLGYIHSKGIIHGDLKCDNILLSDEYRYYIGNKYYPIPKLADFGISQISPNSYLGGTPGYIAPEVYEGSGLNKKTDIFALGMVMFEILSGLRPIPSDLDLAMELLAAKIPPCSKEVLRIAWERRCEELLPGIKKPYYDAFYTIMIKCIDDDPDKRPIILSIFLVVRELYNALLKVTKEEVYDESESLKL